jgi:transposase
VVAVLCDNVIIHRSKLVQRWLATHPRLVVLHGARYSPHDNPTERIWAVLKAWLANSPTLTIQGRDDELVIKSRPLDDHLPDHWRTGWSIREPGGCERSWRAGGPARP